MPQDLPRGRQKVGTGAQERGFSFQHLGPNSKGVPPRKRHLQSGRGEIRDSSEARKGKFLGLVRTKGVRFLEIRGQVKWKVGESGRRARLLHQSL